MFVKSRPSSVYLVLFLVTSGVAFDPATTNSLPPNEEWPSCAELRNMWLKLRSMTHHSEVTNEIPQIPTYLMSELFNRAHHSHQRHRGAKPPKGISRNELLLDFNNLVKVEDPLPEFHSIRNHLITGERSGQTTNSHVVPLQGLDPLMAPSLPTSSQNTKSELIPVFFGGFPSETQHRKPSSPPNPIKFVEEEQDPLAIAPLDNGFLTTFGTGDGNIRIDPNEKFSNTFSQPWDGESDVGSFGKFFDEGEDFGEKVIKQRNYEGSRWLEAPASIKVVFEPVDNDMFLVDCQKLENLACSKSQDCACSGWIPSRCLAGRCHMTSRITSGNLMDLGAWHGGPLPSSELGIVTRRRRRGKRYNLM